MFFFRRAKRPSWTGSWPVTDEQREKARADFRRTHADTDGLSLYAVADLDAVGLVVAAIACDRGSEKDYIDALLVPENEIALFGSPTHTPQCGLMPIERVNLLHYSLAWDHEDLEKLADHLIALHLEAVRFQAATVRNVLRALDPTDIAEGPARAFVEAFRAKR